MKSEAVARKRIFMKIDETLAELRARDGRNRDSVTSLRLRVSACIRDEIASDIKGLCNSLLAHRELQKDEVL